MKSVYEKKDLLTLSSRSNIVQLGGASPMFKVGKLQPVRYADLANISIKRSQAEVSQVVTIGTSAPTIAADVIYKIAIYNPLYETQSTHHDFPKVYSASLAALSGVAATDRANIYTALVTKINADNTNGVSAVATAGTDIVITDDGSYLSGRHNAQFGGKYATVVELYPDENGLGFVDDTHRVLTTEAVYARGVGSDLITAGTRLGPFGHLAIGSVVMSDALNNAVSGQFYDLFVLTAVQPVNYDVGASVSALMVIHQSVWVDNGTGSDTTNLAGYRAFLYEFEQVVLPTLYEAVPGTILGFFTGAMQPVRQVASAKPAAALTPTGAAGNENQYSWPSQGVHLIQSILGTQTLLNTGIVAAGLRLTQDLANDDGMEFHSQYGATSPSYSTVGDGSYSVRAKVTMVDVSDADEVMIGLRSAVAVQANVTGYDDIIALNINAGNVEMVTEDANSGTRTATDTLIDVADLGVVYLEVQLLADGTTKFFVNDIEYSGLIAAPVTHTADQVLIPFMRCLNAAAGEPGMDVGNFYFLKDILDRTSY